MPVTTRRRAAALAAVRPSALKSSPNSRRHLNQSLTPIRTQEPQRKKGKLVGSRRRLKSLPQDHEAYITACDFGHRLYTGEAPLENVVTISPKLRELMSNGVDQQARYYERKLAQVSADLAASGDMELWMVHDVVDVALGMLRKIGKV